RLLPVDGPTLLLDLVQEESVDQLIADRHRTAVRARDDEIRVDLGHLLGDQPVLGNARGIDLRFVPERHGPEPQEAFALLADVPDVLLEPAGRGVGAELPLSVDENADSEGAARAVDSGDEGVAVGPRRSDPDRASLAGDADVADADVVVPGRVEAS